MKLYLLTILVTVVYGNPGKIDPTFACPTNGLFANGKDCRLFYQCNQGTAFIKECPKGLKFDDWWKVCNWENDVRCGPLPPDFRGPTTTPHPTLAVPLCPVKGEVSCSSLTQCIPGQKLCDGVEDCHDKSDEVYCPHRPNVNTAPACDATCVAPYCYCNKIFSTIPGGLPAEKTPQMIMISISGTMTDEKYERVSQLFQKSYTNPNGCGIRGTFFLSHPYTNYYLVQKLNMDGHEIGIESLSQSVPQMWWQTATTAEWKSEIDGENRALQRFSKMAPADVRGARAPFFQSGGDNQFKALIETGLTYDTSILTPYFEDPSWPFTLDRKMPFSCSVYKCPNHSYKGLWEVPLNNLYGNLDRPCVVLDQCYNEGTEEGAYNFLMRNFNRHYSTNRGPLNLVLGDHWLNTTAHLFKGLNRFIQHIVSREKDQYKDVWFVSYNQVIQWMKDIISKADPEIAKQAFDCPKSTKSICPQPNSCALKFYQETRYITTCDVCPRVYPWLNNFPSW